MYYLTFQILRYQPPVSVMTSISLFILSSFSIHISSLAALLCYGITIIKEYEDATNTHCNVWNILPSFSSTIGNYTPQRYVLYHI